MDESFAKTLTAGGNSNALGKTDEVIAAVLADKDRLEELYQCLSGDNAWVRMRAMDAMEKVGREHSGWLSPYVGRFQTELADSTQASVLWHLAQIYRYVDLTPIQKRNVIVWLERLLSTTDIDWIVAANTMKTLVRFTHDGSVAKHKAAALLRVQQNHSSKTVIRMATKLLAELS